MHQEANQHQGRHDEVQRAVAAGLVEQGSEHGRVSTCIPLTMLIAAAAVDGDMPLLLRYENMKTIDTFGASRISDIPAAIIQNAGLWMASRAVQSAARKAAERVGLESSVESVG